MRLTIKFDKNKAKKFFMFFLISMEILSTLNKTNLQYSYTPSFRSSVIKDSLPKDVFTKSSKSNFLAQPTKEIIKKIKQALESISNKLGFGGEAEVWKIGDSGYCVRIPRRATMTDGLALSKDLKKQDKVNHVVAKFSNGITIMPIIKGFTFYSQNVGDEKVARMIENMPVESFIDLIEQAISAERKTKLVFDSGPKNIIVNPDMNKMTAIDFYKTNDEFIFSNQILRSIYSSLTGNLVTTKEQKQKCAGKIILAIIPILEKQKSNYRVLGMENFVNLLHKQNIVDNANYANVLRINLKKLRNPDSKEYVGGVKILKTLVKQLFNVTE